MAGVTYTPVTFFLSIPLSELGKWIESAMKVGEESGER